MAHGKACTSINKIGKRLSSRNSDTNIAVVTSTGVIVVTSHETNAIATRGAKCRAV